MRKFLKKALSVITAVAMVVSLVAGLPLPMLDLSTTVSAAGVGADWTWNLTNGVLTVSGTGQMIILGAVPWDPHVDEIESIVISQGLTDVSQLGFENCRNLKTITLAASIRSVNTDAFKGCTSLQTVNYLGTTDPTIESGAFGGAPSTAVFKVPCNYTGRAATLGGLTVSKNPHNFSNGTCTGCRKTCAELGHTWVSGTAICCNKTCAELNHDFSNSATNCRGCGAVGGVDGNITWSFKDDVLTLSGSGDMNDYELTPMPWAAYSWGITRIVINKGITSLGAYAFDSSINLKSVTIPSSVTKIGGRVFSGCGQLESITIPSSVTEIDSYAFEDCDSIKTIRIPNSVTSIKAKAFRDMDALESVVLSNSLTEIDDGLFGGCINLKSVTIPSLVTTIVRGAFRGCTKLESVTIPASVTSIGSNAFEGCESLKSVKIPSSVTIIGMSTFENCYSLESVTMPDSLITIGVSAFKNCRSLEAITIPDSVSTINQEAFSGLSSLKSVTIPASVMSIGPNAFASCDSLETISYLGTSLPSIGDGGLGIPDDMFVGVPCDYTDTDKDFGGSAVRKMHKCDFSVSDATVTATCTNAGCGEVQTMTLVAPTLSVYGGEGDAEATVTGEIYGVELEFVYKDSKGKVLSEAPTDAGTYTANITVEKSTVSVQYTIAKTDISDAVLPEVSVLTYNGAEQALLNAGTTSQGVVMYSLAENGTYSIKVPTGKNAGNYTVWYYLKGDSNHNDGEKVAVDVTIGKAQLDVHPDDIVIKTGASVPVLTLADFDAIGLMGTDKLHTVLTAVPVIASPSDPEQLTAGEYEYTVSGMEEADNYNITYSAGRLTVTDKEIQTIAIGDISIAYGKTVQINPVTNGDGEISCEISTGDDVISIDENGNISTLKAGTALVKITAAETDTYAQATEYITVTVGKIAVKITARSYTVTQGNVMPALGCTMTGVPTGFEMPPTPDFVCAASDTDTVGVYPIAIIALPEHPFYSYTYVNGSLTVKSAPPSSSGSSDSSTSGNTPTPSEPSEGNKPQIGESGKTGWSAISEEIEKAQDGDVIVVDTNDVNEVPECVFDAVKGKDVDVVFDLGNGFMWTINGKNVTDPRVVDMGVNEVENVVPVKVVNLVTDAVETLQLSLSHNGEFGFTATLLVNLGEKNDGYYANLFHYVHGKGLEFTDSCKIEGGKARLNLTHASDWLIAVSDEPYTGDYLAEDEPGETTGDDTTADETTNDEATSGDDASADETTGGDSSTDDGKGNNNPETGVILSLVPIGTAGVALVATRKRKRK